LTSSLAQVLLYRGQIEAALPEYRVALERVRALQGALHAATAQAYANLGATCLRAGHLEESRRALDEALSIRRQLLGDDNMKVAELELIVVELLVEEGKPAAAAALAASVVAK